MIRLLPDEFKPVTEYIYSLCAVTLDSSKGYLIEGRLARLVEESGAGSFVRFVQLAKADPTRALPRRIIDAITTNETSFFRDSSPFDLLRHKLVPDLIDRRKRSGPARIRIWSAASSTGQEIYSIAITLKETLGNLEPYAIQLIGTDISDEAVARASRGIYTPVEIARGLTPERRDRHFRQTSAGWQIGDELRAMASFRRLNLMDGLTGLGRFDIIFCRNVAIYFNERDKVSLFNRLGHALEPGGALIIGSMESIAGVCPQFKSQRHMRAVYYRVGADNTSAIGLPAFGSDAA